MRGGIPASNDPEADITHEFGLQLSFVKGEGGRRNMFIGLSESGCSRTSQQGNDEFV